MMNLNEIDSPTDVNLLVAFADLTKFASLKSRMSDLEICELLNEFYEVTGDMISSANGMVFKFMGDAALIAFPEDKVSDGVLTLKDYKEAVDNLMIKKNLPCRLIIKAHYGSVICAPMGTKESKKLDIIGETVNTTATMTSFGIAMTAETFRKLTPEARKSFKKHTPPIRYISIDEKHRD